MTFGANGGISAPWAGGGHFRTAAGQSLNMLLAGTTQVSGHITYQAVLP